MKARFDSRLDLKPESLSVSGQSIDATVAVDEIDSISEQLSEDGVRLAITRLTKVVD